MKKRLATWLYDIASAMCTVADKLAPYDDSAWRCNQQTSFAERNGDDPQ